MKKVFCVLLNVILFLVISGAVAVGCFYCYNHVEGFRSLFGPGGTEVLGKAEDVRQTLAMRGERAGLLALYIFTAIIIVQILTLFLAGAVLGKIRRSEESAKVKLAKLANADIFLDLPLYIGLFGSVSSFMVMSFSSSSGQLIAYSSTLIGIIFCTCMRLFLMFPLKSRLISESQDDNSNTQE